MNAKVIVPAAAVILVICLLASAGCATIPGPDVRFTPSPTKTPIPVTPHVKTSPIKIGQTPVATVATTATPRVSDTAGSPSVVYESRTCAQFGGTVARPGETCPGEWLNAADTFNCCSKPPVRETSRNTSVTIKPFILVIDMDDDPGSILP